VGIATIECVTNQGFQSLVVSTNQSNEFWYYWVVKNRKEFLRRANGSTFPEISGSEVRKLKVWVPTIHEQKKIVGFLSSVDDLISFHQEKITRAEEWKKGLMQRMFV